MMMMKLIMIIILIKMKMKKAFYHFNCYFVYVKLNTVPQYTQSTLEYKIHISYFCTLETKCLVGNDDLFIEVHQILFFLVTCKYLMSELYKDTF
jgi:hypothetical protein